jgi:hypothetical protein
LKNSLLFLVEKICELLHWYRYDKSRFDASFQPLAVNHSSSRQASALSNAVFTDLQKAVLLLLLLLVRLH